MERQRVSSRSPWEPIVGYSRAVRVGAHVFVAGTAATDETGAVVSAGDARAQAAYALAKIRKALEAAGAGMADVVRTRMFVTDITQWQRIGEAHAECFRDVRPASTMVEVRGLFDPAMLVEIEVDAIIGAE
jgi:enamine deaminase RidA (YjgF/YER057c/UK114 family)